MNDSGLQNVGETTLSALADEVTQRLTAHFGKPIWRKPLSPIDELVSTILSQNTNDNNRDFAFDRLKQEFSTWEEVRDAPVNAVIDAIRPAGLANQKGPRIQNVLREITKQRGSLDLSFLEDLSPAEIKTWLLQFKGVGPKTAAIMIQFALNKPAFPVDTHIYRVSGRLGLRPAKMSVEKTHDHLENLFRPESYYDLHLNIIQLGRTICKARKPLCNQCPLNDICAYYQHETGAKP